MDISLISDARIACAGHVETAAKVQRTAASGFVIATLRQAAAILECFWR